MATRRCRCIGCIMPPYILRKLLESTDREIRETALSTLVATARLRGERAVRAFAVATPTGADGRRTVFDCRGDVILSNARVARTEQGQESRDPSVNRAFDGFGATRTFYMEVLGRNSIDDHGMRLDGYVHRGRNYNNAFWDGQQMVFGDGDGRIFTDFTSSVDVIAHELTHGVTEHAAGLEYHVQSGALNESMSDVFGSLVKQWSLGQSSDQADWLIGPEVFTPGIQADALRSMKDPGSAFDNDLLGRDPQPDHMSKFAMLPDDEDGDFGGVHINSGIPNKAFYLTAINVGGNAWEAPGQIWYESLKASSPNTQFQEFADTTFVKSGLLYGAGGSEQKAVLAAWREVGIRVTGGALSAGGSTQRPGRAGSQESTDDAARLSRQLEALSRQVAALSKEIAAMRKKG